MVNDSHPTLNERSRWDIIVASTQLFRDAFKNEGGSKMLEAAMKPYLHFVERVESRPISLGHRLYILFMGRLPRDF